MDAVTAARNGRSEAEILSRSGLPVILGGREWPVRPRTIAANRLWQDQVREAVAEKFGALENVDDLDGLYAYLGGATDTLLDLVIAYDDAGVLPERPWILENATDHEVLEALLVLMEQSFPFFDVGRRFLPPEMRGLVMARVIAAVLVSQASTSEPSPPGDTVAPKRSTKP